MPHVNYEKIIRIMLHTLEVKEKIIKQQAELIEILSKRNQPPPIIREVHLN